MNIEFRSRKCIRGYAMHGKAEVIGKDTDNNYLMVGPAVVYKEKDKYSMNYVLGEQVSDEYETIGNVSGAFMKVHDTRCEFGQASNNVKVGPFYKNTSGMFAVLGTYNNSGVIEGWVVTIDSKDGSIQIKEAHNGIILNKGVVYNDKGFHFVTYATGNNTYHDLNSFVKNPEGFNLNVDLNVKPHAFSRYMDKLKNESWQYSKDIENIFSINYYSNSHSFGFFNTDNNLNDLSCTRYDDGTLEQGNYLNGLKNGCILSTFTNGDYRFTNYYKNERRGLELLFNNNKLIIRSYKRGVQNSKYVVVERDSFDIKVYNTNNDAVVSTHKHPENEKYLTLSKIDDNPEVNNKNKRALNQSTIDKLKNYEYHCNYIDKGNSFYTEIIITKCLYASHNLEVPDCVDAIGKECFKGMNINSLYIPGKVKQISENAFLGCGIKKIKFDYGLLKIEKNAFYNCQFTEIVFPKSLMLVKSLAFSGCKNLKRVYISKKCTIEPNAFPKNCEIIYINGANDFVQSIKESFINFGKGVKKLFTNIGSGISDLFKKSSNPKPKKTKKRVKAPTIKDTIRELTGGEKIKSPKTKIYKKKPYRERKYHSYSSESTLFIILMIIGIIMAALSAFDVIHIIGSGINGLAEGLEDKFGFNVCNAYHQWIDPLADTGWMIFLILFVLIGYVLSFVVDVILFILMGIAFLLLLLFSALFSLVFEAFAPIILIILFIIFTKKNGVSQGHWIYFAILLISAIAFYLPILMRIS